MIVLPFHVRVKSTGEVRPIRLQDRWGNLTSDGRGWRQAKPSPNDVPVDFLPMPLTPGQVAACICQACRKFTAETT